VLSFTSRLSNSDSSSFIQQDRRQENYTAKLLTRIRTPPPGGATPVSPPCFEHPALIQGRTEEIPVPITASSLRPCCFGGRVVVYVSVGWGGEAGELNSSSRWALPSVRLKIHLHVTEAGKEYQLRDSRSSPCGSADRPDAY
jgi:hypothetical protein